MSAPAFSLTDLKRLLIERIGLTAADIPEDPHAPLADTGLDSLAVVEVQLALHQVYGVPLPDDDAIATETLAEMVEHVNAHVRAGATS
jgi:acyl carrier protein